MTKFIRLSKRSLKNAQHFAFIDAFLTVAKAANFNTQKISALITDLTTAFAAEDRWYMVARASEIVKLREEADRQRDTMYGRLSTLARLWAGSGDAEKDPAATAVQRVLKLYKLDVKAQMDEETGVMDNLIADLQVQQMRAHVATLGGTWLLEQMVEANDRVKSLRLEQGTEESAKVKGALDAARRTCDKLYDEVTYLIEAYALTAEDAAPYEAFIRKWNGTLQLYQDMLERKSGKSSSSGSGAGASGSADGDNDSGADGQNEDNGSDAGGDDGGSSENTGGSGGGSSDEGGSDDGDSIG